MAMSKVPDKQPGAARVDQEKSTDEIFEHVIHGVRLSRLRELLRRRKEQDESVEDCDVWGNAPEPRPA
ncbi:MAG TPA: hypothetical protein VFP91_21520 [Vicinamibacterales bacterium]|nr:hypothetical protein [Vicinamibacterales bacterium]